MQNIACTLFVYTRSCALQPGLLLLLLWEEVLTYSGSRKTFPKDIQPLNGVASFLHFRCNTILPFVCWPSMLALSQPAMRYQRIHPGELFAIEIKSSCCQLSMPKAYMLRLRLYKTSFATSIPPCPIKSGSDTHTQTIVKMYTKDMYRVQSTYI